MKPVTTVGELRAAIAAFPDEMPICHPAGAMVFDEPGLYVVAYAPGTCSPGRLELHDFNVFQGITITAAKA